MKSETPSKKRLTAFRKGHLAEYKAALALMMKGYRILAIRYKTRMGEIDIIARKGELIVCAEVKARGTDEAAIFAVSATAQARIRSASDIWLSKQPHAERYSFRYDIIAVSPWKWPRHFPDAF